MRRFIKTCMAVGMMVMLCGIAIQATAVYTGSEYLEDWESDTLPPGWVTFGARVLSHPHDLEQDTDIEGWALVLDERCDGTYCIRSGVITHSQASVLEITLEYAEEGTVAFALEVSSEGCCDLLRFYIDGEQVGSWGGEVKREVTFPVSPGEHTFRWAYVKDGSWSSGEDAAWLVDHVHFVGLVDIAQLNEVGLSPGIAQEGNVAPDAFTRGTIELDDGRDKREVSQQYSVEVPSEGAAMLAVVLESVDGGNLALYGRRHHAVSTPPDTHWVRSDFASASPGSVEILLIGNPSADTKYWFVVENPENRPQDFLITAWLVPEIRDGVSQIDESLDIPEELPPAAARLLHTREGVLGLPQYRLEIAEGDTLILQLEPEGELTLHVRVGLPVGLDPVSGEVEADLSYLGPHPLVLRGTLLPPGSYYVAVEGQSPPQEFILTMTVVGR